MADSIQKPQVLARPFCSNGDKNTIPDAATGTNLASLQEGFPEITGKPLKNGGIPPERRDFNGLLNMDSQFYFAFQNGWRPTFDADVSTAIGGYAAGAILWYDAGNYFVKSLKNNNTDNFVLDPSKIDGVSWLQLTAGEFQMPLFSPVMADYSLNKLSWLRTDDFTWHPGSTYTSAYNHLVDDIDGKTSQTETIGSYTITYYLADDGHKIVLADQETTVQNIYTETGVAWYYILDTGNIQFKLPRTKYGFSGLRDYVGNYIPESLPNIKGDPTYGDDNYDGMYIKAWNPTGPFVPKAVDHVMNSDGTPGAANTATFDASAASSTYQDNAPVQERSTQMYLYLYVGNFSETATEQTAGLNSELFNQKVDKSDMTEVQCIVETYSNGKAWYRIWSDGWCEQGDTVTRTAAAAQTIVFPLPFADTNYTLVQNFQGDTANGNTGEFENGYYDKTTTGFTKKSTVALTFINEFSYIACGYIS